MNMTKIFDVHCHIYPHKIAEKAAAAIGSFYSMPMRFDGSVESLLEQAESSGTTLMAVHSAATTPHQVSSVNKFISETQRTYPNQLIGFGTLHPDSEHLEEEFKELMTLGLQGIKLHPDFQKFNLDSVNARKMFALVGDTLPFLIHMGDERFTYSAPERLKSVKKEFPDLKIIAAHFGGWTMWRESTKILAGTPGLYVDCSSSLFALSKEESREIIRRYGADQVIYGSDYPMWNLQEELERLKALELADTDQQKILWDNAQRFLKL